jgi:monofunctional biosynthetic peptidoglycan transglycosylase
MIARKLILGCLLFVVGLYALCATGIFLLRWINPASTMVQMERRLQALLAHQSYQKHYEFVSLPSISADLQHAVVAAEDGRFRRHHGFDWIALHRALGGAMRWHMLGRGGSTITQQLVKNLFLITERSLVRKGAEFALVPPAEAFLTKDRILELYLNVIEWGPGIYGAEAASEYYYHVHAYSLSREQAARLAAIIPAPLKREPGLMNESSAEILYRLKQGDLLDMADNLLHQGHKDTAAETVGSVLAEHLRRLALKHGPVATVYSELDRKSAAECLDLRDKATRGKSTEYTQEQVTVSLRWVRDFIVRHPA